MSQFLQAIIIAIIQGLTEWLPVSSSGHLVLAETLLNYNSSLTFQVALHFGTLMSVFVYFGKDITDIIQDFLKLNFKSQNAKLGIYLIIATIPAALAGILLKDIIEQSFTSLTITTIGFSITGLILIIASLSPRPPPLPKRARAGGQARSIPKKSSTQNSLNSSNSLLIGLSQILALIPGISRSGTTISSGLLLRLDEKTALKFSFLMSIPIIFGANILTIGNQTLPKELIWASLVSFIIGLITLHLLYKHILTSRKNLRYFGYYALTLAFTLAIVLIL